MPYSLRTLDDPSQLIDWLRAMSPGFGRASDVTEEEVEARREGMALDRCLGSYDEDGRCVATFRTFAQRLTVPGGAAVRAEAVTNVSVRPTHRRRGLLTSMIERAMAVAKERGEVCSTLISAEYPIYGRYGYGPAAWRTDFEIDIPRSGLDRGLATKDDDGHVELVTPEEFCEVAPDLFERFRTLPQSSGVVDRSHRWWLAHTGLLRHPGDGHQDQFHVVYRSDGAEAGSVEGIATYAVNGRFESWRPEGAVDVDRLHATTPAAERALWHYLLSIDWTVRLRAASRAPDDVLPLLLPDPRAARVTTMADYLWLRPLDVPALLTARSYPVSGSLVLEVTDDAGLANGRFRLDASADGSDCVPTTEAADLTLPVGSLGALSLGDESASKLLRLGRLDEHRVGAAALADVLLRTARRPWCPDVF